MPAVQSSDVDTSTGWCANDVSVNIAVCWCSLGRVRSWVVTYEWSKSSISVIDAESQSWVISMLVIIKALFSDSVS